MERVFETSQRVVLDRLELLRFEVYEDLTLTLRGASFISSGTLVVLGSWFLLMAGVVRWLDDFVSLSASLAIVGAVNAVAGTILLAFGVHLVRRIVWFGPEEADRPHSPTLVTLRSRGTTGRYGAQ